MIYNLNELTKAYQILDADYKPSIELVESKLQFINDLNDKIEFLKLEKIKYLLYVQSNSNLKAASGVVTLGRPHSAGFDGWIDLKIEEIELSLKTVKKNTMTSYVWQNNPDKELPELYSLMINKYNLIASETTFEQFKAVFTKQPIDESFEPIRWHQDNASELLYFIDRLEQSNNIEHKKRADYKKITACFVNIDGKPFEAHFKSLKTNIEINLSLDKQKAIDELVSHF